MGLVQEFKEFAVKGNVVDMAVGVIVGGAFGKVVSSLVADVIMPAVGLLIGGVDFSHFAIVLKAAQGKDPGVSLKYGVFVQTTIDFFLIAASVFMMVKAINGLRRKEAEKPAAPPEPSKQEVLLTEIRDALKAPGTR